MTELNTDEIISYLKDNLSERRFNHSLKVSEAAERLARINGADPEKMRVAGLLHDICKELDPALQLELVKRSEFEVSEIELNAPKTHHAIAGAVFVKEKYGITDPDILSPIRWHTVGKGGMNINEQILYMADLISDDRDYNDCERIRAITYKDLDAGLYEAFKWMLQEGIDKFRLIPRSTFDAYNEYTALALSRKA